MKLNNFETRSKTYWSIIETFYNGSKIPIIQPLSKDGKREYNFKIKANNFNNFFASRCTPLVNNSKLSEGLLLNLQVDVTQLNLTIV